jgi:hypothetical protein
MTDRQTATLKMHKNTSIIIIIIIIIITIIIITFMQCIYSYTVYLKQTTFLRYQLLQLLSVFTLCAICNVMFHVKHVLHFYTGTSRTVYAVPNMVAVCSSLILCFPGMLLRYGLSHFEMVPVAPTITGITRKPLNPPALYFCCKLFIP